jgi:glycosyltransferase involved in cell wall biosynthesis
VIKNPVVKDYLFPPSANPKLIKSPKLVFIGRLSEEKQPGMFLDICRETKIPGVIFGDGPLRSEIEDRVKTENIDIELRGFTTYPWVHLDIAGPAFLDAPDAYRGKGGTGSGVRLLFDFIRTKAEV